MLHPTTANRTIVPASDYTMTSLRSWTHNLEVVHLHRLVHAAARAEALHVVHRVDLHGALLHFAVDAHAVVHVVHLMDGVDARGGVTRLHNHEPDSTHIQHTHTHTFETMSYFPPPHPQ